MALAIAEPTCKVYESTKNSLLSDYSHPENAGRSDS
jgi:hypothetical protein